MMYFIELSQFLPGDGATLQALRAQMGRSKAGAVHWAEWQADSSNARSCPDVALINAAHLEWRQLKALVDGCSAETVVLTGREDSVLSLPVLPRVDALNDLLRFMPSRAPVSQQRDRDSQGRFCVWVDTTPMPLMPARTLS